MKIILDPTREKETILKTEKRIQKFPHARRDAGAGLIKALQKLSLSSSDKLQVIVGPGSFAAIRTAVLIGNAVAWSTNCQLFAKTVHESEFHRVTKLQPFYTNTISIISPKK